MTGRDRWVRRTARKVPVTVDGRAASSTNPATWASYRQALASGTGAGLGFVLNGDGIVCVDLDHCLEAGEVAPWARRLLDRFPATYVEVSPSGDGLHVFGFADVVRGRHVRLDGGRAEVYGTGRFICVTGDRFEGAPARLADMTAAVAALCAA
ncbi:bifunctional DNA primase/polymerase [Actinomadura pelletieri]|nr:bifunctional DNA primase/polymerase [Actinomadura pelletieri]